MPVLVHAQSTTVAALEDAFIVHDEEGQAWTIGNSAIRYEIALRADGTFAVVELTDGEHAAWDIEGASDARFAVGGRSLVLGGPASGMTLRSYTASESDGGVLLALTFEAPERQLRVIRYYQAYPLAPAIETWLRFEATTPAAVTLSEVVVWQLGAQATSARWITGLQAKADEGGPFTRRHEEIRADRPIELESTTRSSEPAVPVVWLEGGNGQLVGGLMWSGSWAFQIARPTSRARLTLGLGDLVTTTIVNEPFDTPHAFFGATPGGFDRATAGLRTFIDKGVRRGRPFPSLVTYNSWFAYGIDITEDRMREEMAHAADFGAELFVLDAGWYPGGRDVSDFTTGLGSWAVDADRFPSGLRGLSDYAHEVGLQFGLWVEPERMDLRLTDEPGLAREEWLATSNGHYNPGVDNDHADAAQICLGDADARAWLLERLFAIIDQVQPDYLKWDNNFWINCNRADHDHGPRDGSLAHVRGLYAILEAIRERYPSLAIENCSGGGNRLDFGMLRLTDTGWMDDRSAPSSHVRHNLEGLLAAFPGSYLFSFVMNHEGEPMAGGPDLPLYFRSRMPGVLGLTYQAHQFGEADINQIKTEIATYKTIRDVLRDAASVLLTEQVREADPEQWDVVQATSASSGNAVLFGFQGAAASERTEVRPQGLDPEATYSLVAFGRGDLGIASGADLMDVGIELIGSPTSAAHLILVTRVQGEPLLRRGTRPPPQ